VAGPEELGAGFIEDSLAVFEVGCFGEDAGDENAVE
jgi:hypothetical protein